LRCCRCSRRIVAEPYQTSLYTPTCFADLHAAESG
jgi:hypothetical protein